MVIGQRSCLSIPPPYSTPLVLFKCLIKKVKCFPCDLLWRDRVSGTNCQSICFHRHMGGKKRQIDFFSFFFPIENPNSQFFTNSSFSKETVESPFLLLIFFLQRIRFSPPSRVSILLQQNEASKCISLVFHLSSYFFFSLLPLLCIVTSIYNSLHLARLQMSVFFFLCLDFCSSNICLLSVANGEQILLFCSVTKAFDILTSLLFDTVRI